VTNETHLTKSVSDRVAYLRLERDRTYRIGIAATRAVADLDAAIHELAATMRDDDG
jgi:hypothetical protein